ncbi:MAG: EAL domain-containing protein [Burkholderiaceae bacterium]
MPPVRRQPAPGAHAGTGPDGPDQQDSFRTKRFRAVVAQLPLAVSGTFCVIGAGAWVAWQRLDRGLVAGWAVILGAIALAKLLLWWRWRSAPAEQPVPRSTVVLLAAGLAAAGLHYAWLAVELMGSLDAPQQAILSAVLAGFVATGAWIFSGLPVVALAWVASLGLACAAGLLAAHGLQHALLAGLLVFYSAFLAATVVVDARRFGQRLLAEHESERQRQFVGLLLRDFEADANDWLWETDAKGRLCHVSERLVEAAGRPAAVLQGCKVIALLGELQSPRPEHRGLLQRLAQTLRRDEAFSTLPLCVVVAGQERWWSISGKPLRDSAGRRAGWRGVSTDVTDVRERDDELARLARTDTLTGLANRHRFGKQLQALFAQRDVPRPCTLLMLDLDHFKTVNDSLGHAAGDSLLQEVARRLRPCIPGGGLLARLGGDEFAVLLPGSATPAEIRAFCERLRAALAPAWFHEDHFIDMRVSIGAATAPQDAATAEDLLAAADMALYEAKAAGRDRLQVFDAEMNARARRKLALLGEMRQGLHRGEFFLVYQPMLRLNGGGLAGFEALVRWRHPEHGVIPPLDFVPLAEESGLIVPLGAWVMNQACLDAASWPAPLTVSVNVSPTQLERSDIRDSVARALSASQLAPRRLELELTESVLMRADAQALLSLGELRQQGVRVALDDFGTGYSSLAYLRQLPLDKLKIDRSFVQALGAPAPHEHQPAAIVRAIVQLGKAVGLDIAGEGIETPTHAGLLQGLGCDLGQGFLFAAPMPQADALRYIERQLQVTLAPPAPRAVPPAHAGTPAAPAPPAPLAPPSAAEPADPARAADTHRIVTHSGWVPL